MDVIFSTSGSTGTAKRIVRTEESLRADAAMLVASHPELWENDPVVVSSVRPDHMYGALWCVRAPEIAGCRVDAARILSVEELAERIRRYGRVLFVTTPSFLEKALRHPDFIRLRGSFAGIVTAGSLLRTETARVVAETLGTCPFEIYGTTETGSVAWRRQVEDERWTLFPGIVAACSSSGALTVDSPHAMSRPFELADGVRLLDATHFTLLGRLDRRVKILEQFVSLPDVEAVLESHPLVSRAVAVTVGDDVPRLGALVVLTPEGRARLAEGSCADLAAILRTDLLARVGESAFPRRLRFVRELPQDEQGKMPAELVRGVLSAWCAEPVVLDWQATAESLEARLVFPPDLMCFKGHFPGFPILPGVAQLFFLRHFAQQAFPDFPETGSVRRLKFQRLVRPKAEVTLAVTRRGPSSFSFQIANASGLCSSGLVEGASA